MDIHWDDPRFSLKLLRSSEGLWFRTDGLVQPGLINVGALLGVGTWGGLPKINDDSSNSSHRMTELPEDPMTGADIIVSILYQHSISSLLIFFLSSQFEFIHRYDEGYTSEKFSITRAGNHVTAGFWNDRDVNGTPGPAWVGFVRYELVQLSNQETWWCQLQMLELGEELPDWDAEIKQPSSAADRAVWEAEAVMALAPALTERRWMVRQGVSQVELTFDRNNIPPTSASASNNAPTRNEDDKEKSGGAQNLDTVTVLLDQLNRMTRSEKLAQTMREVSEVDYDAEGETVTGESPHTPVSGASAQKSPVIIPHTEDFDDVAELLLAAGASFQARQKNATENTRK